MLVFWVVSPSELVGRYQRFGGTHCLFSREDVVSITTINWLMLFRATIAVYCENRTKSINTLCCKNTELLRVKADGIYNCHCVLKGSVFTPLGFASHLENPRIGLSNRLFFHSPLTLSSEIISPNIAILLKLVRPKVKQYGNSLILIYLEIILSSYVSRCFRFTAFFTVVCTSVSPVSFASSLVSRRQFPFDRA
jgi:hypothetical protein